MNFNTDIFTLFDKKWALLTAGTENSFNTMTISWGGLGTLWGKPVATVYVRTSRYTHDFMDDNEYFTISFYPEQYHNVLGVLETMSGRDMDKMKESGLTAQKAGETMTFKEAEITIVSRKLFKQELDVAKMPEKIACDMYSGQAPHDMYIGEVVEIIQK